MAFLYIFLSELGFVDVRQTEPLSSAFEKLKFGEDLGLVYLHWRSRWLDHLHVNITTKLNQSLELSKNLLKYVRTFNGSLTWPSPMNLEATTISLKPGESRGKPWCRLQSSRRVRVMPSDLCEVALVRRCLRGAEPDVGTKLAEKESGRSCLSSNKIKIVETYLNF